MPRGGKREGAGRPKKTAASLPRLEKPEPIERRRRKTTATVKWAIARAKDLTQRLLDELDAVTTYCGELEDLIIDETVADRDLRRRNAMLRAVDLPSRAATLKVLVGATRAWADLEKAKPTPAGKTGKKAAAAAAAETAGKDSEWGSDLDAPTSSSVN